MDGTRRSFVCGEAYRPTGSVDIIWRVSRCRRPHADDVQVLDDAYRRVNDPAPVLIALALAVVGGAVAGLWFAR